MERGRQKKTRGRKENLLLKVKFNLNKYDDNARRFQNVRQERAQNKDARGKSMINDGTIHYTSYVNLRPSVIHG